MVFSTIAHLFGFQTSRNADAAPKPKNNASARPTFRIMSPLTLSTISNVGDYDSYMDIDYFDEMPQVNLSLPLNNPNALPPTPVYAINTEASTERNESRGEPRIYGNDQFGNSHSPLSSRFAEGSSSLSTRMPTFSRKHNKGDFFTDDYVRWNELIHKLFMGYIEAATNTGEEVGTELTDEEESDMEEDKDTKKKYKSETNDEAMANAIAMGVQVRDFAVQPPHEERFDMPVSSLIFKHCPVPEVFPAHEKALQFLYIWYLLEHDVFDLPRFDFTCADVDRLVTCKFVQLSYFDPFLLRGMLAIGFFQRCYDRNPLDIDREFPPRARWTIPKDSHPPTHREIREYIVAQENERYAHPNTAKAYLLPASERPELTEEYKLFRQHVSGAFGLSAFTEVDGMAVNEGIPDELLSFAIRNRRDRSYISPRRYRGGEWKYRASSRERKYFEGYSPPERPGESIPRGPPPRYSGLSEPGSSERDRGEPSDGKKRARPSSPGDTRARLSEKKGQSSAQRGTKRARDDEDDESAPAKKLRRLDGGVAIFSEAISAAVGSAVDVIQSNLSAAGAFISSVAAQSASLLSPAPGGEDVPAPEPDSSMAMEEVDDVWRPHPPAPAPLQRQNAFYYKNGETMPPLSGRYELPAELM